MAQPKPPGQTFVALYDDGGSSGTGVPRVSEQLGREAKVEFACVGPDDIRGGALSQSAQSLATITSYVGGVAADATAAVNLTLAGNVVVNTTEAIISGGSAVTEPGARMMYRAVSSSTPPAAKWIVSEPGRVN